MFSAPMEAMSLGNDVRFVSCDNPITLLEEDESRGVCGGYGGGVAVYIETLLSAQFCCQPKASEKTKSMQK
jgi:hypothetical protein